ncbi:MAG: hypothetical protein J5637_08210 [Prevotella sp.]|nr:hypothetical protein [Prevotella sp.]
MHKVLVEMAGISFCYALEFADTIQGLRGYVKSDTVIPNDANLISVGKSEYDDWRKIGNTTRDAFAEYSLIGCRTSEYLMAYDRFIFHGVAISWHGHAWLITAPPGIGKSTQYKNLSELYPDEIGIINGDKPIIELRDDNTAFVHPSPWNGKERWHGADGAPLAGIIFLKHGENSIAPVTPKDVATRTYFSIFQSFDTKEMLHRVAALTKRLLQTVPIWELTNRGDHVSSELIYNVMKEWEVQHHDL